MSTETLTPTTTFAQNIRSRSSKLPELLAFGGYVALLIYAIPRHEPWADEAQAWQLARSVSIQQLFTRFLREEGSPGLWHLLLAGISRLHVTYSGYHWFAGIIATIGAALLIFLSPFPRSIRLALPFTFFFAFQYAVVARSYVLAPALMFCLALAWRRSPIVVALLLGLLGNLSAHVLMISIGFAFVYLIEIWRGDRKVENRKDLLLAGGLLAILYGFALWTVLPIPSDLTYLEPYQQPLSLAGKLITWSIRTSISVCFGVVKPGILAVPLWIFIIRRFSKSGRLYYVLPIVTFALFSANHVNFWHAGLVIPTVVTLFWIGWPVLKRPLGWSALTVGIVCFILMQWGWTLYALGHHPYASASTTARFLAPRVAAGDTMALTYVNHDEMRAFNSIAIAPYFDHPIFLNQQSPFWIWRENENTPAQFLAAMARKPSLVLVVFYGREKFDPAKHLYGPRVEFLAQQGYRLSHTFCAAKPEGFGAREETCDLIFEPATTSH
jgi:hypothetical protein